MRKELTAIIYYYLILNNYYSLVWLGGLKEQHSVCSPPPPPALSPADRGHSDVFPLNGEVLRNSLASWSLHGVSSPEKWEAGMGPELLGHQK